PDTLYTLSLHDALPISFAPWVGTLSTAYKSAKSIVLNNVLGQDFLKLTAGKGLRVGSVNVKLASKAVKNANGTWTLTLASPVTADRKSTRLNSSHVKIS